MTLPPRPDHEPRGRSTGRFLRRSAVLVVTAALSGGVVPIPASAVSAATAEPTLGIQLAIGSVTTGTAPFDADDGPGNDSGRDNDVLRTHDTIEYTVELGLRGAAEGDRATIRQRLPEGLVWPIRSELPGFCGDGSTVSDDRRTLECVVAGLQPNQVTAIPLSATLTGTLPHGTILTADEGALTGTAVEAGSGAVRTAAATPAPVTASGSPRLNIGIARSRVRGDATGPGGVPGWRVEHDVYLSIAGYGTDGGRGARGQARVTEDVTAEIDLSTYPAAAVFEDAADGICAVGARDASRFPGASGGGASAVTESGRWDCVRAPGDPRRVLVAVSGADLSGDHVPRQSASGADISSGGYLAVAHFDVFVPLSAVPPFDSIEVRLGLQDLRADGEDAGGASLPNASEPLDDNVAVTRLHRIEGGGSHSTMYVDEDRSDELVPGQSSLGAGDGPVIPGQDFQQRTGWVNTSTDGVIGEAVMCQVFDTTTQRAAIRRDGSAPVRVRGSGGLTTADLIVEYGTSPVVDVDASAEERQAQLDAASCRDDDDAWSADPSAVDLDAVTRVRVRPASGAFPAGAAISVWTNLRLLETAELGEPVTATYSIGSDANGPDVVTPGHVVEDGWWHGVFRSQPSNANFPHGDQLIVANAVVGVDKRASDPVAEPGSPVRIASGDRVTFEIRPTIVSTPGLGDRANRVILLDSLPAGLVFDPAASNPPASAVLPQDDGSTLLRWEIDVLERGREPVITYTTGSDVFTAGDLVNRVIVGSPDDPSSLADFPAQARDLNPHYALQTISLASVSGLRVAKAVDRFAAEPGVPIGYTVSFANMGSVTEQRDVRVVDVLPFPGDERGSDASAALAAPASVTGDAVVRYTDADAASVLALSGPEIDTFGTLPDGRLWCSVDEFGTAGCPVGLGAVTALTVIDDVVPPGERIDLDYALDTAPSASGDVLVNQAIAGSDTQVLRSQSFTVTTRIVTTTIGRFLWWDENGNGLADDGDGDGDGEGDGAPAEVRDVTLTLTGTDRFGSPVERTTRTDAHGVYEFTGLVSGEYRLEVDLPDGAVPTAARAGDDRQRNSAIDPLSGAMEGIVVVDPAPTLQDGLDTTWNGGLVATAVGPEPDHPEHLGSVESGASGWLAASGAGATVILLTIALVLLSSGGLTRLLRRRDSLTRL